MTKIKFGQKWLEAENPCGGGLTFAKSCNFDFAKIYDTCERGDWLIWLLRRTDKLYKPSAVKIAIACAQNVLEIFEKKYPTDKRPRQAIEAALKYSQEPTENNRKACKSYAADAAYAADARKSQCKWQADKIREIVLNPFR